LFLPVYSYANALQNRLSSISSSEEWQIYSSLIEQSAMAGMYQRRSEEEQKLSCADENVGTRFVSEAKNMTGLVLEDAGFRLDRNLLLKQHEMVVEALEDVWNGVEKGDIEVDCLPLLRTARNVSCPEISRKLTSPEIDHTKLIRDLRLLVNVFTYVIKPKRSRFTF